MADTPVIGVLGGMGPYAGLDLVRKIFDLTDAASDQEHLPVALLSYPHRIRDRSQFLADARPPNPALALADIAQQLDGLGATVAGIPCNTAHAPAIFDVLTQHLRAAGCRIRLLHLIEEAVRFAREHIRGVERIGVLSTLAVYRLGLYQDAITAAGFEAVLLEEPLHEALVNRSIFDRTFGIKAQANPVTATARQHLLEAIMRLQEQGAQAVILGCTELPLAIPEPEVEGVLMIDSTMALARALIRETYPEKLKQTPQSSLLGV